MQSDIQKEILCEEIKKKYTYKKKTYRNFNLQSLKLLIGYLFPSHCFKIMINDSEMRFDIYLLKKNTDGIEVNIQEVQNFRSYWGKGFNVKIISDTDVDSFYL